MRNNSEHSRHFIIRFPIRCIFWLLLLGVYQKKMEERSPTLCFDSWILLQISGDGVLLKKLRLSETLLIFIYFIVEIRGSPGGKIKCTSILNFGLGCLCNVSK